jgi:DNA-binding protein YbaB
MDSAQMRANVDEMVAKLHELQSNTHQLQEKLKAVTATAKSSDGFVTAIVGARGELIELTLDPRIYRKPDSAKLAHTITETIQQATEDAMGQIEKLCEPMVPVETQRAQRNFDFDAVFESMQSNLDGGFAR